MSTEEQREGQVYGIRVIRGVVHQRSTGCGGAWNFWGPVAGLSGSGSDIDLLTFSRRPPEPMATASRPADDLETGF